MRSFSGLALRRVRARRARALLTAAGIVLGVGMILGVLLLAATINRTFTDLFDSVYGETDLVVSGSGEDSLRASTFDRVARAPGVEDAAGNVLSVFTLIGENGLASPDGDKQLNVAGQDPRADDLTGSETVAGREPRRGLEIALQESWASAQDVQVGDRIRLATPDGEKRFDVVGLFAFSTGLDFGGQGFAAMPLREARDVMDKPGRLDEINVVVSGGESRVDEVQRRLRNRLPGRRRRRHAAGEERRRRIPAPGVQRDPLLLRRDGPLRRGLPDLQLLQHERLPAHAGDRHAADAGRVARQDRRVDPHRGRRPGSDRCRGWPGAGRGAGAGADRADALARLPGRRPRPDPARPGRRGGDRPGDGGRRRVLSRAQGGEDLADPRGARAPRASGPGCGPGEPCSAWP